MTRMKKKYVEEVAPALMEKFQYKSVMQIPKIDKIVVSVGCGDCKDNAKALDNVIKEISAITGQHAVATVARKSVANFKLREGMHVGVKVTLRQDRMWEFLDRLLNVALPRVRDFRGISADAFDGRGNYALGLKEQLDDSLAIGKIIMGQQQGRTSDDDIICFIACGMSVFDLGLGYDLYQTALEKGIGTKLLLWENPAQCE